MSWRSEFDAATDLVLDLDQPLKDLKWLAVPFAAEGGQHPRVIVDRGHGRAQTLPERRSLGPATQVVVTLRARRLGDDLQLTRIGLELKDGATEPVLAPGQATSRWADARSAPPKPALGGAGSPPVSTARCPDRP